jgi:S1-C subfamily serine protease
MTSTPSTQSPSPTRGGSVGQRQFRELALASVDDPNTTLAISEWSAEDGCPVDDWDAIAQGTPGLGYTVSHEAILSSLAMDPPSGVQDRGDVPERPVA